MNSGETQRKNLIEFKAGKMVLRQNEGMVWTLESVKIRNLTKQSVSLL